MPGRSEPGDLREASSATAENEHQAPVAESDSRSHESDRRSADSAEPGLSPAAARELEARAHAAEQQALNLRSRLEEMRDQMERQADETRQRLNRAADERALGSKTQFVTALLPVLDNLQRSLEAARDRGSIEALLHGLERTLRGFETSLAGIGVEPIKSVGEPFDPAAHEAVDTVEAGDREDGLVTHEYSRGYQLGERLLRPARVQVGRAGASRQGEEEKRPARSSLW